MRQRQPSLPPKDLRYVPGVLKELQGFPEEVRETVADALNMACNGEKADTAKPLKGYNGAGVLEIVEDDDGNTYRAVYTVKFAWVVYVIHAFQKKSKSGKATPRQETNLIGERLRRVEAEWNRDYRQKYLEAKARLEKESKDSRSRKSKRRK
jgi:phage-related protein